MYKWAERAGIAILLVGVLVYIAAKVHFVGHFDPNNIEGYLGEHWPFWAGMALLGVLLYVVGRVGKARSH